jgi:hypothetical protein
MMPQNRIKPIQDALIATMFAILMVQFSGSAEPWLPIACGLAAAVSLSDYNVRTRSLLFLLVTCLAFLESAPWFLGKPSMAFGISGLVASTILLITPNTNTLKVVTRAIQVLPMGLIVSMMPISASIFSSKTPKRAILNGGVWATVAHLPEGQEALSTTHQYTYEKLQKLLAARVISSDESLATFDELIIITPTTPFSSQNIQSIRKWTHGGGRLIIIADHTNLFGHQTVLQQLTDQFGIGLRPDALFETETNGGIYGNILTQFAGLTPCSISKGVIPRLKMAAWSENPDYTASSFFGELDPTNDDRFGHYPILGSKRYGLGEVAVFTDSTFFANFAINRWSSQTLLSSLLWTRTASTTAILGVICLLGYLIKPKAWLLVCGGSLVFLSPSLGFSPSTTQSGTSIVKLARPEGVANESEERDKGTASSLLASAYAFDVTIEWDQSGATTFRNHIRKNGIQLKPALAGAQKWPGIPTFDIQQITDGKFYIDQNSFWFSQGAGLIRTANMANLWRSLGAKLVSSPVNLAVINKSEKLLAGPDGKSVKTLVTNLSDNWVIIDERIVAKWIPESSKWLARKEWQLGPWLKKDLIFEPIQGS